ncbi:MAG: SDR family oxidoreductase [Elusimicrobia bacterium]|nr:SDR family oxidoreductase [Elusimicrobiota bacterium]
MSATTRVAVVTGGARRLGRHLSMSLAARGYALVILYRSSVDEAQALTSEICAGGGRARALSVNVAAKAEVAAAFANIATVEGRVDLLVNNVGNYNPQDVTRLDPDVWDETIGANLSGAYYCCHHALAVMPDGGNIINIGMAGLEGIRANPRGADYYVSKTGLLVLTRALAVGYAARQIRVNMVSPGQLEHSVDLPTPEEMPRWVPLRRSGTLADISQAVSYLLDAGYVTGVNLDVAGGYRL